MGWERMVLVPLLVESSNALLRENPLETTPEGVGGVLAPEVMKVQALIPDSKLGFEMRFMLGVQWLLAWWLLRRWRIRWRSVDVSFGVLRGDCGRVKYEYVGPYGSHICGGSWEETLICVLSALLLSAGICISMDKRKCFKF